MGLLDSLNSAFYTPQEDPFGIGAGVIGAAAPGLTSPYQSSGKNIGTAVGAALLAGLLGGYAKKRTNEANQGLLAQALGALNTRGEGKYDALSSEPRLAPLAASMRMSDYENQIERASKEEEAKRDLNKAMQIKKAEAYYNDPATARNANPNIESELGITAPVAAPGPKKEETILDKISKLPKEQREIANRELPLYKQKVAAYEDARDLFEQARTVPKLATGILNPTGANNKKYESINQALTELVQLYSAKEKSGTALTEFDKLRIGRTDSTETINHKEKLFNKLINASMPQTPILEETGIAIPAGAVPKIVADAGGVKVPTPGQGILAPDGRNIFIRK